jgi:lysophospholipase L1-like esterase
MGRRSSVLALGLAGVVTAGVLVAANAVGSGEAGAEGAARWVNTWTAMPQLTEPANMPPPPFTTENLVLANSTLRQTMRVSMGGQVVRLRFSNAFGGTALPITGVSLALPAGGQAGVSAIQAGSARTVTFHGKSSVDIPVGAQVVSDPIDFALAPRMNVTVTMYLAKGQASTNITSHPGSRTASYMTAGNHLTDGDLPGATSVTHWYFLSGTEVLTRRASGGVVMLGDSLTDGRGSTPNMNNRWPDQLLDRLQSYPATDGIAVLNEAAGGNRVLNDGLGPNALARLDRDVLAQSGVRWLIVFEGINDIGTAEASAAPQKQVAEDLIDAYEQIIVRAHAQGIRVYGATLLPFSGNSLYDDPTGNREAARQTVNRWIRTSHRFDAVIDFDAVTRDPADARRLLPSVDEGDHLHLNPFGYKVLADAVPAALLR